MIKASDSSGLTLDRVLVLDSGSFGSVYAQDATILNSVISQSNFLCTPAPTPCRATEVTGTISDSTIISAAELGTANSNDTTYHNSPFGDRCDLTVQNTLAVGRVYNLRTNRGSGACTPTVVYNYSWIPTSGTGGGISDPGGYAIPGLSNLPSAPAALTDPLGGNFTPAFGSPAINAGLDASSEDLYGRPRPIGIAHDIGAVEAILPPTLSTVSVGTVTSSSAPVSATVNPNGGATTYNFQLRKAGTSEWGSFDGATTGDGATAQSASGTANPLDASTDYEVRIVGANSAGEVASSPVAFRTPAAPAPTLSLTVSSLKAKVGKKGLYFTSRATVNAAGSLSQTATTGTGKKTKTWCRTMTTARAAATYSLKCNLGSKGRRYLKKRSLVLTVKTTLRAATGASVT
ncbi:MAG: choice-of-anchor Q domain-containing protein, partial [Solirubrobacterales bacterium]